VDPLPDGDRRAAHRNRPADDRFLAQEAAVKALKMANLPPAQLDLIIVSTSSPEHIFPATACLVQDRIGAHKAGAFDLSAACTGFIFALNMGAQAIRSGSIQNALIIGAETLSKITNWQDRNTCILFGDGAGAFLLQASEEPGGVLSAIMRSDGSGGELLSLPAGGSRLPTTQETVANGLHYIHMNGREVFRFATRVMAQATEEVIEAANLKIEDIDLVIPHQANQRIIDAAARGLEIAAGEVRHQRGALRQYLHSLDPGGGLRGALPGTSEARRPRGLRRLWGGADMGGGGGAVERAVCGQANCQCVGLLPLGAAALAGQAAGAQDRGADLGSPREFVNNPTNHSEKCLPQGRIRIL
jgi:3-oxoacyl-[acyl-carrier-protein] synthase III